ncbi:efflux RND transporter periplasmic adaptor subunit, partial [Bordetella pseudohinzii]
QNMNLVRAVAEAMDEAIDQNTTLCLPQDEGRTIQLRAHQKLAREFGNRNVLTVPFAPEGEARGALLFERPDNEGFDRQSIELCQSVALLAGRVLYQRLQRERPLWRKGRDALLLEAGRLFGARYIGRKLLALAVLAVALFGALAHGPYRVGATATVQGVVQRVVAAPFDGYIADAAHRAGDEVKAGEALAALDTRETELELLRAGNLEVQYRRQAEEAMARGDNAAAAIAQAQARQAMAQIQFYREQIQRSSLRAPFDGILVSGDLSQQLGEAVKRGQELFKISPLDGYRLWLDVEDRQIDDVALGQTGRVALAAMPDRQIPFTVTRIVPLAQVLEGKTVFRLEARLDGQDLSMLRPGMEGIGRIDIGERRYAWIWTHGFVDWLRLKWWAWFG